MGMNTFIEKSTLSKTYQVKSPSQPLISYVTSGRFTKLSMPQCPHLKNQSNNNSVSNTLFFLNMH